MPEAKQSINGDSGHVLQQARKVCEVGVHGALHLFSITNSTDDGMGAGTVNTQRMLASLGRADTIPGATKLQRINQVKKDAPPRPQIDGPNDHRGRRAAGEWQAELDEQIKEIEESTIMPEEIPGLKVHVCLLVAPDSPAGQPWTPVYIHSKLMIVNDVFTTHGSANINTRSMQVDSELNIAYEWGSVTQALRQRLWGLHTGWAGAQDKAEDAFAAWTEILDENSRLSSERKEPACSLVEFIYEGRTLRNLD